ncbi:MAG: tetratricopeptide repeat protein [Planctomycetota bacterium]|nr:MAG: tetratricopeptide repeat protein [Planctomycetota bacterium]
MLDHDMSGFGNHFSGGGPDFGDGDSAEERSRFEAEELMRQGRYQDAAARYQELRRLAPTDFWVDLAYVSALECAGKVGEAENILEEAAQEHRRNRHLQRFRRMFFERREDPVRAGHARRALAEPAGLDDEPLDSLADLYFNQGRYLEAQNELRRLLGEEQIEEDDSALLASIHARLGACLRQEGDLEAARTHLKLALEWDADNHWTLSELAEVERADGQAELARRHYQRALELNPDDQWCRGHLAQLEHEQGNSAEAVRLYEGILEGRPEPTWALVELAQVLTETDPERSRNLALQALQEDPSYPWAYAHLGHLARQAGRLEEARHRFQQALSASPGSSWILHELADTCRHMGRMEEALTHLEHARNNDPFDPTTCGFLGDALRSLGRLKESRAHFAKAVELDPAYTWAWRELAEVQALLDEPEAAQQAYETACQLEPGEPINDGLMAFLLRCRGDRQGALPFLRRACERMPNYAWAWRELSELQLADDAVAEAEASARAGLAHLPQFGPLRLLLSEALRRQGRRDEALVVIEAALADEPEVPQLWAMRAELVSDKDPQLALRYARRAARIDPAPEFQLLLAQVLRLCGRNTESRTIAREISRAHPQAATAWLLLSDVAESRKDLRSARVAAELGCRHCPDDWRLRLRLARLEWMAGREPGIDRLQGCFAAGEVGVPWREAALFFAQAGRDAECHRALSALMAEAGSIPSLRSEAWRSWCECEVHLGHHQAALAAIHSAIDEDSTNPANRLLAAALLEQHDQGKQAMVHLEYLAEHLGSARAQHPEQRFILRQLAGAYARHGQLEPALGLWQELLQAQIDPELLVEMAVALRSAGRAAEAQEALQGCWEMMSETEKASPLGNALLVELALAAHAVGGADAALQALRLGLAFLNAEARELYAQLLLASGDATAAHAEATSLGDKAEGPARRRLAVLRLRAAIALGLNDALALAETLATEDPEDETVAVLLAEMHLYLGQAQRVVTILAHPSLPARPGIERCLLWFIGLLESQGPASALHGARLWGESLRASTQPPPLLQVLALAWPQLGDLARADSVNPEHLRSFPPVPRAAEHCARALAANGHGGLAVTLAAAVAEVCDQRHGPGTLGRRLWICAAHLACAAGLRGRGFAAAWRARSPLALLRCLRPW